MDGYTRRIRRRSGPPPPSLEILEDRFLMSALGYAPGGAGISPDASGGQPPAAVHSTPAASPYQGQKGGERLTPPAGGASPAAAVSAPGTSLPTSSLPAARGKDGAAYSSPALSGFLLAAGGLHVDPEGDDRGSGPVDLDGDSPFQETLVASLLGANGGAPGGNGFGANDGAREPPPGAAPVPSLVAVQPLGPSGAAMGLREAVLAVAAIPPRPEGAEGDRGETMVSGSSEQPNAAGGAAPVEPQGVPQTAQNRAAPSPAPPAGYPLTGLLPLDVDALRGAADAFFTRLADLSREPAVHHPAVKVALWLGGLTAVAYEWARAWKKPPAAAGSEDGWGPGAVLSPEGDDA
jgi:hypothetical protein